MNIIKHRGFTLIELLVVIAIIGILASVVMASLSSARRKGRDARRIADIKQLQTALELYYDANGNTYPAALDTASIVTPGYIATISTDPTTLAAYPYDQLSSGSSYCLGADLETSGHTSLLNDSDCTGATITNATDVGSCVGSVAGTYCYQRTP